MQFAGAGLPKSLTSWLTPSRRGFTPICSIEEIDVLVTDHGFDPVEADRLREAGVEVILT